MKTGRVVSLQGAHVEVVFERSDVKSCCGAIDSPEMRGRALNYVGARIGDRVTLAEVSQNAQLKAAVLIYVVPLIVFIGAYLGGTVLAGLVGWPPDAIGIPVSIAGLIASFFALSRYDRSSRAQGRLGFQIVEIQRVRQESTCLKDLTEGAVVTSVLQPENSAGARRAVGRIGS